MALKVVGLGEALWDVYADARYPGGAPANVAVHAHRLGAEGIVASGIGQDALGDELLDVLSQSGVNTDAVQRVPDKPTGTVGVTLDAEGKPHFDCSKDTAFDHLGWTPELESLSQSADAIAFGTLAQRNSVSRETIQTFLKKTKALRVFDVNFRGMSLAVEAVVRETLPLTDILKVNEDEAVQLRKAFGQPDVEMWPFLNSLIAQYGLKLIALSLGERGCYLSDGRSDVFSPGLCVKAEDTTGCGDAFLAAMIVQTLNGTPLEDMARFMNRVGALVATRRGAVPEYTGQELVAFGVNGTQYTVHGTGDVGRAIVGRLS